jgi:hypothetical protein
MPAKFLRLTSPVMVCFPDLRQIVEPPERLRPRDIGTLQMASAVVFHRRILFALKLPKVPQIASEAYPH